MDMDKSVHVIAGEGGIRGINGNEKSQNKKNFFEGEFKMKIGEH